MSLGVLQLHLLWRLSKGALGALALVYLVTALVAWVEELEHAGSLATILARAHATSWEMLTSVVGLCVSIGAGCALAHFARERGGVATALGGGSFVQVVLPAALALSALVGLWRWRGPTHDQERGAVCWGEAEWGWISERSDSSLEWLWIRHDGLATSLSVGRGGGSQAPPARALAALDAAKTGLPAWVRESIVLLLVLMTLSLRLDRRPDGALPEAVPIALLGHWGPLVLTPLVHALTDSSAAEADAVVLCLLVVGLLFATRLPLR